MFLLKNPKIFIYIIRNTNLGVQVNMVTRLSRSIINSMYDNVMENQPFQNRLYQIIAQIIKVILHN